ncbi:GH17510 [Drosophila grimshawi]|uniref:GH17510 n=1 Tax=Drosophila grimshawi TaxID=7222 RepID=B4JTZ4_DROGR|nr:GH17510 [Drosophila grimshawi]
MVIGVFPIGKIAVLGIKQITTPLSLGFKQIAKRNLLFKNYICAPAGQLLNSLETRCKIKMLGLPQPKRIPRLPEKNATEMGANILSELFVILLGLSLIFYEVSR